MGDQRQVNDIESNGRNDGDNVIVDNGDFVRQDYEGEWLRLADLIENTAAVGVVLIVGKEKKEIITNYNILILSSPYFKSSLTVYPVEPIQLEHLDPDAVQSLLNSVTSGKGIIPIRPENVKNILLAAHSFQHDDVRKECIRRMIEYLSPAICLEYCAFAKLYGFAELQQKADEYKSLYFTEVCESEGFLEISYEDLKTMITNCSKPNTKSSTIFLAIKRWVEFDESSRKIYLPELMGLVNFEVVLDEDYIVLKEAFASEKASILRSSAECMNWYRRACEVKAFQYAEERKQCTCKEETLEGQKDCNTVGQTPEINGGMSHRSAKNGTSATSLGTSNLEAEQGNLIDLTDSPEESAPTASSSTQQVKNQNGQSGRNTETTLKSKSRPGRPCFKRTITERAERGDSSLRSGEILSKTKRLSLRIMKNSEVPTFSEKELVYIRKHKPVRRGQDKYCIEAYNFQSKKTITLHRLNPPRDTPVVVAHNNQVFVMGGTLDLETPADPNEDQRIACNIVDIINLNAKSRVPIRKEFKELRKLFAGCVLGDYVYAIGGFDEFYASNWVERFNLNFTAEAEWENGEYHLNRARGVHDVSVLNGKIYAIGGNGAGENPNVTEDLKSVECYDPNENNDWKSVPDMNHRRGFVKTAVLDGKLYAVGGSIKVINPTSEISSRMVLNTVEVFDPKTSTWTDCPDMHHCRSNGMVFAENHLLYAIAGNSGANPSMEVFNPERQTWTLIDWPEGLPRDVDFSTATLTN